jgi:hypothetical protein
VDNASGRRLDGQHAEPKGRRLGQVDRAAARGVAIYRPVKVIHRSLSSGDQANKGYQLARNRATDADYSA